MPPIVDKSAIKVPDYSMSYFLILSPGWVIAYFDLRRCNTPLLQNKFSLGVNATPCDLLQILANHRFCTPEQCASGGGYIVFYCIYRYWHRKRRLLSKCPIPPVSSAMFEIWLSMCSVCLIVVWIEKREDSYLYISFAALEMHCYYYNFITVQKSFSKAFSNFSL